LRAGRRWNAPHASTRYDRGIQLLVGVVAMLTKMV
jgi:hypothetical protein